MIQTKAELIVIKETDPDGARMSHLDSLQTILLTSPYLMEKTRLDTLLNPGTYNVTESDIPDGWSLESATCDDGSSVGAISLQQLVRL